MYVCQPGLRAYVLRAMKVSKVANGHSSDSTGLGLLSLSQKPSAVHFIL